MISERSQTQGLSVLLKPCCTGKMVGVRIKDALLVSRDYHKSTFDYKRKFQINVLR